MAIMTVKKAVETKTLETAFEKMGMKEKLEELWDIIDDIELENELEESWQECQRGECEDVFEALAEIQKELDEGR